jgi:hypothetical protein
VRTEHLGVRNTEAGFDAISLSLIANRYTAARLGFNTNGQDGDGLAAQFGAKFLFDRGEIGVEIDKQPIDRRTTISTPLAVHTVPASAGDRHCHVQP